MAYVVASKERQRIRVVDYAVHKTSFREKGLGNDISTMQILSDGPVTCKPPCSAATLMSLCSLVAVKLEIIIPIRHRHAEARRRKSTASWDPFAIRVYMLSSLYYDELNDNDPSIES